MRLTIIATVFCTILFTQFIEAQETVSVVRKGFVFGTSLGLTTTYLKFPDRSENHSDLGMDLKIGYMVNSKLAILLTSSVSIYDYSGFGRHRKRDFGILSPSIQYWLKNKFWFLGGVGIGGDNPVFWDIKNPDEDPLETKYYSGLGVTTSMGYELLRLNNSLVIDVKARALYRKVNLQEGSTTGFSYGILLGINFY